LLLINLLLAELKLLIFCKVYRAVCVCLRETLTHWCVLIDEQVRLEEVILETRWLIRGWRTERQKTHTVTAITLDGKQKMTSMGIK